ncbi:MAG: hypothetical protein WCG84_01465 [Candidatus Moraniibacteriota bacterium]
MVRLSHFGQKQKKYPKSHPVQLAFGLVEVVLAMFVLTTALMVVMLPAINTIQYTKQDRQVVLGAYLAQEGVEVIRNIRDTQFAQWEKDKAKLDKVFPDPSSPVCSVDYTTTDLKNGSICKQANAFQKGDAAVSLVGNFYQQSTTNPVFWRKAVISKVVSGANVRYDVTVYVVWGSGTLDGVNTTNCIRSNQCVFSQATFTDWNYWSK